MVFNFKESVTRNNLPTSRRGWMKKQMIIATGLALLSSSAYATKARMQALGQDQDTGSHYIKDSRSIFKNAAHVNTFKNYVVAEWGTDSTTGTATAFTDSNAAPEAEGGFFREMGSFAYGVYLGSQNKTTQSLMTTNSLVGTSTDTNFNHATAFAVNDTGNMEARSNDISLFFGGDMGVQWGAHLVHSQNKQQASGTDNGLEKKHDSWGLGLGAIFGDIEGYVNLRIADEHEGGNLGGDKAEGDFGFNVGLSYAWNSWTFFGEYDAYGAEYTDASVTNGLKEERKVDEWLIGFGHIHEVTSTARVFTDFQLISGKDEAELGVAQSAATTSKVEFMRTPLTIGFETDATSWLTFRGSISQVILINDAERSVTSRGTNTAAATNNEAKLDATTDVAAGATLTFGKLMIDGVIGNNGTGGSAGNSDAGALDLDRLMARVAVHYWF